MESKKQNKIIAAGNLPSVSKEEIKINATYNISPVSKDHMKIADGAKDKLSEQVHKQGI